MRLFGERQIWVVAAVGAVAAGVVIVSLFRSPKPSIPSSLAPVALPANVGLSKLDGGSGDKLLREEATLRDPTPLFLPTNWNAAEDATKAKVRWEPGGLFSGYEPRLTFAEAELQLSLPKTVALPENAADALTLGLAAQSYWGFGQMDLPVQPLPARGAYAEVLSAGTGQRLLSMPMADANPPGGMPWQPLQFLVAIDAAGIVRPPVLTESSQVAAVDGYFKSYLAQNLHVGERLGPGFYRVSIGP